MGIELYTEQQFINAISTSDGNITEISERVGCTWHTAKKYIDTHENVNSAYLKELGDKAKRVSKERKLSNCVYLIRDSLMGSTKIGITSDVQRRLWDLQIGCPQDLELIGFIEADHPRKIERELHDKYKCRLRRGEWFDLTNADIDAIMNYHSGVYAIQEELLDRLD